MTGAGQAPEAESGKPTAAGLYDAYLGGDNHSLAEQEAAEKLRAVAPELDDVAWSNRAFHQRVGKWLAGEAGIRQFIDLGSGLPTQDNTHQVVQRQNPEARVVYVDIDPRTVQNGRALVEDDPNVAVVHADIRDVEDLLNRPELRNLIDLSEPVGILASAVFHFVSDDQDPWGIARRYVDAVASGSYLALSHLTADRNRPGPVHMVYEIYRQADTMMYFRGRNQFEWLFDGLELVPPYEGAEATVSYIGLWGCEDPAVADDDAGRWFYCGVGKKP